MPASHHVLRGVLLHLLFILLLIGGLLLQVDHAAVDETGDVFNDFSGTEPVRVTAQVLFSLSSAGCMLRVVLVCAVKC